MNREARRKSERLAKKARRTVLSLLVAGTLAAGVADNVTNNSLGFLIEANADDCPCNSSGCYCYPDCDCIHCDPPPPVDDCQCAVCPCNDNGGVCECNSGVCNCLPCEEDDDPPPPPVTTTPPPYIPPPQTTTTATSPVATTTAPVTTAPPVSTTAPPVTTAVPAPPQTNDYEPDFSEENGDEKFLFDGNYEDLLNVYINGKVLKSNIVNDGKQWDLSGFNGYDDTLGIAYEGSVGVILYGEFLSTLSGGTYHLSVEFKDGTMGDMEFEIEGTEEEIMPEIPETLETTEPEEHAPNPPTGVAAVGITAAVAAGIAAVINRRKKKNLH
ncbi:MAG: hypothetical protein FWG44_00675 [Oscillospiraceae bacterium]|nr:hypothetical protein [Oscillospiraceae bacterium]